MFIVDTNATNQRPCVSLMAVVCSIREGHDQGYDQLSEGEFGGELTDVVQNLNLISIQHFISDIQYDESIQTE